jgi:hypothetical protein
VSAPFSCLARLLSLTSAYSSVADADESAMNFLLKAQSRSKLKGTLKNLKATLIQCRAMQRQEEPC